MDFANERNMEEVRKKFPYYWFAIFFPLIGINNERIIGSKLLKDDNKDKSWLHLRLR